MTEIEGLEDIDVNDVVVAFLRSYTNYTPDDKLDKLMKYIPDVIANFSDCSSEEEYRMLAKNIDGTLATITISDPKSGYKLYKPIELNPEDYKKFYYQTLSYSVIYYIMFFMGIEFEIVDNKNKIASGTLKIAPEQLPHILGLENRFVSNKPCALLEKLIPGYNKQNVLNKILSIIEHNREIIEYEKQTGLDIFNYYKNMQKNKDFLMLGRILSEEEEKTGEYNKMLLLKRSENQLSLYKRSNMNDSMNRNICKMIIQRDEEGNYFPRSLQGLSEQLLDTNEAIQLLQNSPRYARYKGIDVTIYSTFDEFTDSIKLNVKKVSDDMTFYHYYMSEDHCVLPPTELELDRKKSKDFDLVANLIDTLNGEIDCLKKYSDLARHEVNAGGKIIYKSYNNGFKASDDKHQKEVIRMRLIQDEMDAVAEIISSTSKPPYKLQDYKKSTQPKPELSKEARERLFNEYHRRIFSVPQTTTTGNNKRR